MMIPPLGFFSRYGPKSFVIRMGVIKFRRIMASYFSWLATGHRGHSDAWFHRCLKAKKQWRYRAPSKTGSESTMPALFTNVSILGPVPAQRPCSNADLACPHWAMLPRLV